MGHYIGIFVYVIKHILDEKERFMNERLSGTRVSIVNINKKFYPKYV
jgi:hypothetical protein